MASGNRSVFDLSPAEKLQLVQDLWDDLTSRPEDVPVPEWQKAELDKRLAKLRTTTVSGATWDQVKQRIRSRRGS
jgi:putative addiction module component (TIGR02574 family)